MTTLRPLWTCPKCGHQFVTPNMWHSCTTISLDEAFLLAEWLCEAYRDLGMQGTPSRRSTRR